jgi:hypothetical protein
MLCLYITVKKNNMKVTNIENKGIDYIVTYTPNWFEKLFGIKEKIWKFRTTGKTYLCGGGAVYVREDGVKISNGCDIGEALDVYRRKFN